MAFKRNRHVFCWPIFAIVLGLVTLAAAPLHAQHVQIDFGQDGSLTLRTLQLFALVTVLSVAPGIAIMVTCFPFMITVFSILRQALGLQQAPPNMLIVSLALFLTWFVMEPVVAEAWKIGVVPLLDNQIDIETAFNATLKPFRGFMSSRVDTAVLTQLFQARGITEFPADSASAPLATLVPAFLLSEIQRAFEIGFLIFLPFLIIDLVVAAVLMSMGMMMVPPAVVSLPFKLAFFVVSDGWVLLSGALIRGYAQ